MDCGQPTCEMVTERGWNVAEFVSPYWRAVNKKNYFISIVFKVRNQQLPFHPTHVFTCTVLQQQGCSRTRVLLMEGEKLPFVQHPVPTTVWLAREQEPVSLRPLVACRLLFPPLFPQVDWPRAGRAGARTARSSLLPNGAPRRRKGAGRAGLPPPPPRPTCSGFVRAGPAFLSLSFSSAGFPWRPGSVSGRRRTRTGTRRASGGTTPPGRKTTTRRRTRMAVKASLRERRRPPGRSRRMRRSLCWARRGNPGRPRWVPAGPAVLLSSLDAGLEALGRAAEPSVHLSERLLRLQSPTPRRVSPCPCIFLARLLFLLPVFWAPFPSYPDLQPGTGADETPKISRKVCMFWQRSLACSSVLISMEPVF